jgi:hypothetical protein
MSPAPTETTDKIVDDQGQVVAGALTFSEVHSIYKNFVKDNKDRNTKNAAITRKLNGEQPWSAKKLKAAGQSWRSNRPTGFMQSMLSRVMPPYKQVVDQLPLLTFARFPDKTLGSEAQQDIFRRNITTTIREWDGWPDFLSRLVRENVGYGYAAVTPKDVDDWHPRLYRSDEALFYVGCPQTAEGVKVWGRKEDFYIDDIVQRLSNPQVAKDAGWQIPNLIKKLNNGEQQFSDRAAEENDRIYEDLIRQNNLSSTFTSSIKVIKAAHMYLLNPRGGIDHYIFDRNDGVALFFRRKRWEDMDDFLALFTAEDGDGTLHGSRGVLRNLYNTHISVEQSRNLIHDALHLSGLLLLKRTTKQSGTGSSEMVGLTVSHPFAIVGDGYEVVEKVKFEINSEAFFALDQHAVSQAEIQIGAFMPGQVLDEKGQRRTASEVNYVASIDAQIRAGVLARFADQMFSLINISQKNICSKEICDLAEQIWEAHKQAQKYFVFDKTLWESLKGADDEKYAFVEVPSYIEQDALRCVLAMMQEGLTKAQILVLAASSSRASVEDAIASQSGALDMVVARYGADPRVDGIELMRRDIASKMGSSAAERIINVDLSPLSMIKQQRQQIGELTDLMAGADVPIDPTDDDKMHLAVIADRIAPLVQQQQIPMNNTLQFLQRALAHAQAHIEAATKKGTDMKDVKDMLEVFTMAQSLLSKPTMESQAATAMGSMAGGVPAVSVSAEAAPAAPAGQTDPLALAPEQPQQISVQGTIEAAASPPKPPIPHG